MKDGHVRSYCAGGKCCDLMRVANNEQCTVTAFNRLFPKSAGDEKHEFGKLVQQKEFHPPAVSSFMVTAASLM